MQSAMIRIARRPRQLRQCLALCGDSIVRRSVVSQFPGVVHCVGDDARSESRLDHPRWCAPLLQQSRNMIWRSNNKRGFDPSIFETYPEEGKHYIEIPLEETEAAIAEDKAAAEREHVKFLETYKPYDGPADEIWNWVDWDSWIDSQTLDIGADLPENLKGVHCTWNYIWYPPYSGASKKVEIRERPHRTVSVIVPVEQFGWSDTQMHYFKQLVSTRYKPSRKELVLKSSKLQSTEENLARVKHMFSTLLDEVGKVA